MRVIQRAGHVSGLLAVAMTLAVTSAVLSHAVMLEPPQRIDPLPSWNTTGPKLAIVDFVTKTTRPGSKDFVPVADRIAVFDMDGTLLVEEPAPAAAIALTTGVERAVARDPQLGQKPVVAALLKGDFAGVAATGEEGAVDLLSTAIDGRTVEEAAKDIRTLMASAKHPKYGRLYTDLSYKPMLELLSYLQGNGFQTWISSASPVGFTRQFSQESFGIPPERVMGTSLGTRFAERDGRTVLIYEPAVGTLNDGEARPTTINLAIGRRPLLVGGNVGSGGDIAMMRYSHDRPGPSLQLLINHDDSTREYAYSEKSGASLNAATKYHFVVVSMKNDWATVFSPGVARSP